MIELKQLKKNYGGNVIFEDVNLRLQDGTVSCFVGHNGCGKSTLLKVAAGLIPKDGGTITCEQDYRFAYVPEKFPVVNMNARTYLDYMAQMDGIYTRRERAEKINEFTQSFYLSEMMDKPMRTLSKGTLQKIGVIQALLCKPEVLLLDEPLSGQDADSQKVFVYLIQELKKSGTIILLAAHEEELIDTLGDVIYTFKDKKIVPFHKAGQRRYHIQLESGLIMKAEEENLSAEIEKIIREGGHIRKVYEEYE